MPPSAIIDSDLDPFDSTILDIAEMLAIWKATTLGGGNAAWTQVFDVANFDAVLGSALVIDRVRRAKDTQNLVYSIGHGLGTDGTTFKEFCGRSSNGGQTWNWYEIGEIDEPGDVGFTAPPWYSDWGMGQSIGSCTNGIFNLDVWLKAAHYYYNEVLEMTATLVTPVVSPSDPITFEYDAIGTFPSVDADSDGDQPPHVLSGTATTDSTSAIGGGYHVTGHWTAGTLTTFTFGYKSPYMALWTDNQSSGHRICVVTNFKINGVLMIGSQPSRAFDVAPSQGNWLYYGATDRIWQSKDGGATWATLLEDTGAHDICVDPQAAGAIYFWGVDGNLNLAVEDVVTSTGLMTETALNVPLRIARDPSSGRLLALPGGTTLTMRNLGSNSDLKTGLTGATGLHAYPGQKLIFLDSANIWISDDLQAATPTITAKKGGWSEYAGPINAHRMLAA
jgi:hypothetical protein